MNKSLCGYLVGSSLLAGVLWAGAAGAQVTNSRESINQVRQYGRDLKEDSEFGQVTSVSEFTDVKPTDWAFLALQSLVERYGCIVGLPTNPPTYQGRRATTRYEFAAGLNACLDRINELIAASVENLVTKEDIKLLQRLQEEFAAELALLRGRVDTLEARTATLEAQQFSTTTKLSGQVILSAQGAFGGNQAVPKGVPQGALGNIQDAATLGYRVNLTFNTSFTGKDLLTTNLQIDDVSLGAIPGSSALATTGTNSASLSYGFLNAGSGGVVALDTLTYEFPVLADKGRVTIAALGGAIYDQVDTLNPLDDDGAGALSAFGLRNPLYNQNLGAGVGAAFKIDFLEEKLNFALGYMASGGGSSGAYTPVGSVNPFGTEGLFGSSFVAYGQLTAYPLENLGLSLLYVRGYSDLDSGLALNLGGGVGNTSVDALTGVAGTQADNVGFQFQWQPLKNFILGGWFGVTWFNDVVAGLNASGTALNYALVFAFPDVGTKGSQAQIVVGAPPYLSNSNGLVANGLTFAPADDVPIVVEASYRFKFTEYLTITPGIFAIFSPEGNNANPTVLVGAIRSTFSF
ncbi:iron uptake porin [Gloeomargarita lithophora]|uniref:iron uptake porin n=1 Tax=Gloeomargarita lithophora TaxID=1188228 RepID=UPI0008F7EDFD|nr:iron uptake porin [Gloeomargarita lithophora]